MKKILLAALVLAASVGSAFAQDNTANNTQPAPTAGTEQKCQMKPHYNPFEGLNITAEQQTKLDALRAECKAKFDQARAEQQKAKADKQKAKAEKKANKQKAKAEAFAKMRAEREQMLAKIKNILTPEQYVKFLENSYLNSANKGPRPGKDFNGPRGDRKRDGKAPQRDGRKMKRDNK